MKEHIIPANPIPLDLNKDEIIIKFNSEQHRIQGFSILFKSNLYFKGIGKNRFVITEKQLHMLEQTLISYRVVAPE